jgi:hypothetical protein
LGISNPFPLKDNGISIRANGGGYAEKICRVHTTLLQIFFSKGCFPGIVPELITLATASLK